MKKYNIADKKISYIFHIRSVKFNSHEFNIHMLEFNLLSKSNKQIAHLILETIPSFYYE